LYGEYSIASQFELIFGGGHEQSHARRHSFSSAIA
jgi:hypothetical protein